MGFKPGVIVDLFALFTYWNESEKTTFIEGK